MARVMRQMLDSKLAFAFFFQLPFYFFTFYYLYLTS